MSAHLVAAEDTIEPILDAPSSQVHSSADSSADEKMAALTSHVYDLEEIMYASFAATAVKKFSVAHQRARDAARHVMRGEPKSVRRHQTQDLGHGNERPFVNDEAPEGGSKRKQISYRSTPDRRGQADTPAMDCAALG